VAARRFESEARVALLAEWLGRLDGATRSGVEPLFQVCAAFEGDPLDRLVADQADAEERKELREARRVAMQVVTYVYFAATLIQLFAKLDDRDFAERALGVSAPPGANPCLVDRLANVPAAFGTDLSVAWRMLSDLREELELPSVSFPGADALVDQVD